MNPKLPLSILGILALPFTFACGGAAPAVPMTEPPQARPAVEAPTAQAAPERTAPAPGSSTNTSTPEPGPTPTKSAEYLQRYESIYAELRADGKSPEAADLYATAYADRREQGKAHDNATLYADLRVGGESEIYATAYADQVEQGKSATYAEAYAGIYVVIHDPSQARPAFQGIRDKQAYVTSYAEQVEIGKSNQYAYAYSVQIDAGVSVKFAEAYARVYDRLRNEEEEADPDEARAYADVFIELYGFYDSYKYANPDDYAEDYTDAYLYQLSEGKSHDYALAYADCKTGNCGDLNVSKLAASYASQRELGKSKAYAYVYSIVRAEDKSPDEAQDLAERYETAYNDLIANGKTHAYARRYAYLHVVSGWEREAAAAEAKWSAQGYREHVAISIGMEHSCAVLEGGGATCWGSDSEGQSSPPREKFKAIGVGDFHSCGLTESGQAICWGLDRHGRTKPPGGRFTAISAGDIPYLRVTRWRAGHLLGP